MADPTLRERKQQRAREQIVDAAYALFAERGFAAVTVTDIAERAEVGRTTFFRYFGDKQEVVFADEQRLADRLAGQHQGGAPRSAAEPEAALDQARELVLGVSADAVANGARYAQYERLIARNPELQDRMTRKLRLLTGTIEGVLRDRGADVETAALAAEVALACYLAARRVAGEDAAALLPALRRAFDRVRLSGSAGAPGRALPPYPGRGRTSGQRAAAGPVSRRKREDPAATE